MKLNTPNKSILVISHMLNKTGAPRSLLNILSIMHSENEYILNIIGMRGGGLLSNYKSASNSIELVSESERPGRLNIIINLWRFICIFYRNRHAELVLINSSVNLRAMIACIFFKKKSLVYVRESELMLNSPLGFLRKRLLNKMSAVVCVSRSTAGWVSTYVDEKKIHVIHNGINIDDALPYIKIKKPADISSKKVIGIIGTIGYRKGVDRIYELISAIISKRSDVALLVIGEISDLDYKIKFANLDNEYPDSVRETGIVDDVYKYISECSLVLMLSREEALPRTVLESSAMKVPVLVTDVAGTREMLPDSYKYIVSNENYMIPICMLNEMLDRIDLSDIGEKNHEFIRENFDLYKKTNEFKGLINMLSHRNDQCRSAFF